MWIINKIRKIVESQKKKQITEEDIIEYIKRKEKSEEESKEKKFKTKYEITEESIIKYIQSQILGKTYAVSDIHGMYGSYMEAINNLKENDTLFVIGDVIDRGKNGIKILQDMMRRKNVKFILGNHEWQMISVLDLIRKYNLSEQEIALYIKAGHAVYFERENEKEYEKNNSESSKMSAEKFRKQKEEFLNEISNVQLKESDMRLMYIWIDANANKGKNTLDEYLNLTKQQQDEVYRYLTTAYVMLKKTIGQQQHCLVHASPPKADFLIEVFEKKPEGGIKYNELVEHEDERFSEAFLAICTETRDDNDGFKFWREHGYKTVYGHTPSRNGQIVINQEDNAVCIDAACSMKGKLALYCLEDGKVKYINPRENYSDMEFDGR